ncbi:hypothetical protein LJ725_23135 [Reyranella aquatilis]|uniref:Cbb3-type cytochrome oxidase assembly protein CcoS n=1 Tax=Reyranella aquatilis TaxID=2035356 RepID=A0ABS8L0K6_9HYPH|nr:hypothetical protein [Reyranella aquatilis]MCC8431879.1 hypothetical protein [Reyranella aquatilis]
MRDLLLGVSTLVVLIVGIFFLAAVLQRGQYQPPSQGSYLPDCARGDVKADPRDCDPQR